MSEWSIWLGRTAGILTLAAYIPYTISILRGKTVPNRASWWIWTLVGFMLGSSYFASGARHTMWVPVSYTIGPLFTAILSLKYGEGGWTRFDRGCVFGAVLSAILWAIFRTPLVALTINLIIDALGALPTIKKSWLEPEKEDRLAWTCGFIGNTANLLAVEKWTFALAAYPIYMFGGCGLIAAFVLFRPRRR